jgi:hypothetical protein
MSEVAFWRGSLRTEAPYNPLDKKNLGVSVADALLAQPIGPLPPSDKFLGAGIYALYYSGNYSAYKAIGQADEDGKPTIPIYVGKAVPAGARKGGFGLDIPAGAVLYNRPAEHAESIQGAKNLDIQHFACRYLVVDDIWIPLGESLLIEMFSPVWNRVIDGFGNHDPGKGRYQQQRSPWDVLHPGRTWAERLQPHSKSEKELLKAIDAYTGKSKPKN